MNHSTGQSNESASLDAIFSALATETRRHVFQYFQSSSETVAQVEDLVAYTLAQNEIQDDPERIAVKLHHSTLPMLDDAGFLEYDVRSNCVRYRENPRVGEVLNLVTEIGDGESKNPC